MDSPVQIMIRLEAIEKDLASRQNEFELAASKYHYHLRDVELLRASIYPSTSGTVEERKSSTTQQVSKYPEYKHLQDAESEYESLKAVMKVLTTRASILQSVLRAQTDRGANATL